MSGLAAPVQCNFTFNTHLFANSCSRPGGLWPGIVGSSAQYYGSATQYLPTVIYQLFHGNNILKMLLSVSNLIFDFFFFFSLSRLKVIKQHIRLHQTSPKELGPEDGCSVPRLCAFVGSLEIISVPWGLPSQREQPVLITSYSSRAVQYDLHLTFLGFVCLHFHGVPAPTASLVSCHPIWGCLTS